MCTQFYWQNTAAILLRIKKLRNKETKQHFQNIKMVVISLAHENQLYKPYFKCDAWYEHVFKSNVTLKVPLGKYLTYLVPQFPSLGKENKY